jgi:hypothetical protein
MEDRLGEEAEAPAFDPDSHVSFNVRNFESEAAAFLGDVINMVRCMKPMIVFCYQYII